MSDEITRRRELRRRRILENAEERKNKIFGSNLVNDSVSNKVNLGNNEEPNTDVLPEATTPSPLSDLSSKDEGRGIHSLPVVQNTRSPILDDAPPQLNSVRLGREHSGYEAGHRLSPHFTAENGIDSVPELSEQLRNLNNLLSAGGGGQNVSGTQTRKLDTSDVQSATVVGGFGSPIVPVILALFVCVLLSVKLDYVVSNSIALPFLLWEAQHLWCSRHIIDAKSQGVGGLMGLALVLCGVQQTAIRKMTRIITVVRCVFEDFAFYILTVVFWYWMIGLPGAVHVANDLAEPEVDPTVGGEAYYDLGDF